MPDAIAVIIHSGGPTAVRTALNLLEAAVAMEQEAHVYFTGDAIVWVGQPDGGDAVPDADDIRVEVRERLQNLKEDGTAHVYACTRAMKAHRIDRDTLLPEVDMPAGFAYFLDVAGEAKLTLTF